MVKLKELFRRYNKLKLIFRSYKKCHDLSTIFKHCLIISVKNYQRYLFPFAQ